MSEIRSVKKPKNIPPEDEFRIRCRKLGHQISFSYCRSENNGLPCIRTLDCWYVFFPVADYLREEMSEHDWEKAFEKIQKPKILSLVELIAQAQKRTRKISDEKK